MYRAAVFAVREMTYGGIWRVYRRELGFVDIDDDDLTDVERSLTRKSLFTGLNGSTSVHVMLSLMLSMNGV